MLLAREGLYKLRQERVFPVMQNDPQFVPHAVGTELAKH